MTVQVTVIGLGQIGTSIGLALAKHKAQITRVGLDRVSDTAHKAEKKGAFDRISPNLQAAVENADIIILAVPVDEIRETIQSIAPYLREESVLLDTSPLKVTVAAWAKEILPPKCYFVSITPSLNPLYLDNLDQGTDSAHEDLFQNSLMVITHLADTPSEAIQLACDLVILLGAQLLLADPYESDGLQAAHHQLPQLVSVALFNASTTQPGWKEGRKLAGAPFARVTSAVETFDERQQLGQAALLNRENVLRVIDNLLDELQRLRQAIADQDGQALQKLFEQARSSRSEWLSQRMAARWDTTFKQIPIPSALERLGRLVGLRDRTKDRK
ncbi:MAG TPA: prephenate dehydrogenase [Anaerolineaceae bacterium]|nr:prephenate dehydrogenase [Anaerolineaceae bacterium]